MIFLYFKDVLLNIEGYVYKNERRNRDNGEKATFRLCVNGPYYY